jgi:predicted DNA-binding WGR domain protein
MARRVLNRRDLRAAAEAVERRDAADSGEDDETEEGAEEEETEEDGEEGGDAAEASDDEDDAEAKPKAKPKPKAKKKAAPKVAKPRKPRAAKKITRMRVVWGVFNNSHSMVKSFPYPQRAEAEALAKQLMTDKKSTHFVNAVKEPMEEKKEE